VILGHSQYRGRALGSVVDSNNFVHATVYETTKYPIIIGHSQYKGVPIGVAFQIGLNFFRSVKQSIDPDLITGYSTITQVISDMSTITETVTANSIITATVSGDSPIR